MENDRLQFDPEAHEYYLDGQKIPGVTDVIKAAGLMGDASFYTEEGRLRGQYVAEATALDDMGDLDWDSLDPQLKPYCEQWRKFVADSGIQFVGVEEKCFSEIYKFGGTLDRRGFVGSTRVILDIKLGGPQPWHAIQLAAYGMTFSAQGGCGFWNVYLEPDRYKRVTSKGGRQAEEIFRSALAIYNWKVNSGVK